MRRLLSSIFSRLSLPKFMILLRPIGIFEAVVYYNLSKKKLIVVNLVQSKINCITNVNR